MENLLFRDRSEREPRSNRRKLGGVTSDGAPQVLVDPFRERDRQNICGIEGQGEDDHRKVGL